METCERYLVFTTWTQITKKSTATGRHRRSGSVQNLNPYHKKKQKRGTRSNSRLGLIPRRTEQGAARVLETDHSSKSRHPPQKRQKSEARERTQNWAPMPPETEQKAQKKTFIICSRQHLTEEEDTGVNITPTHARHHEEQSREGNECAKRVTPRKDRSDINRSFSLHGT